MEGEIERRGVGGGSQTQVPTENCILYQAQQCSNPEKNLKVSSTLTNLVIFQCIYKKQCEVKEKGREEVERIF